MPRTTLAGLCRAPATAAAACLGARAMPSEWGLSGGTCGADDGGVAALGRGTGSARHPWELKWVAAAGRELRLLL